jgi:FtsP/CotA-like multicopper oxidase with cupredoxin domain
MDAMCVESGVQDPAGDHAGSEGRGLRLQRNVPGPQIRVTEGDRVRINLENELDQPRRLHAEWQGIPWKCDTLNVAPGERWDVLVHCTSPGTWAFHCHILPHAESEQGMYGMVTGLIVQPV